MARAGSAGRGTVYGEGPVPACVISGDTAVQGPVGALEEYCSPTLLELEDAELASVTENRVGCTNAVLTQKTSAVALTTNPVEGHAVAFIHRPAAPTHLVLAATDHVAPLGRPVTLTLEAVVSELVAAVVPSLNA